MSTQPEALRLAALLDDPVNSKIYLAPYIAAELRRLHEVNQGANDMNQTILVRIKDVYGTQTVYPVCELACGLAALAGTKTLTPAALKIIRSLGYQIAVESPLTV